MRLATFNCENLFARYSFKNNFSPRGDGGFLINNLAFEIYEETEKQITAKAIKDIDADVVALQEVENLIVLDRFNSRYLAAKNYKHRILIDSNNDDRGIDVGLLSRYPIVSVRSFRHDRSPTKKSTVFSRDCLEVHIDVGGKELVVYVNHFKSMIGGRDSTKERRFNQAARVAEIIDEQWKMKKYSGNYIVLGDLNDYPDESTSLVPLLKHKGLVNVMDRIPENDRWTHFYSKENEYRQLDHMFISPSLAKTNKGAPQIYRNGLPYRAEKYEGPRLDNIGENNPKASDHAAIYMDLELN